ncbi:hypothetical protein LDENG_00190060 [Lucifuga dentata]|nr:hypothetical protein LDENG_00190060 [Lucifuga dentata]
MESWCFPQVENVLAAWAGTMYPSKLEVLKISQIANIGTFTEMLLYILKYKPSFYYQISQTKSGGRLIHEKFKFDPREGNFQRWKYYYYHYPWK